MNSLLNKHVINFNENFILPKNSILLVLRFEDSMMDGDQGYAVVIQGRPSNEEVKALAYDPFGQARDPNPSGQAQSPYGGTRKEAQARGANGNRAMNSNRATVTTWTLPVHE